MLAVTRLSDVSLHVAGRSVPVTFSYGIAEYQPPDDAQQFFNRADRALYGMKREMADLRV
jgi:PleD family two-component response regulator